MYENKILFNLKKYNISFICLAGFMKIISKNLIKKYQRKIINIHPSLLPKFKGLNTFKRMLKNKEKRQAALFIMLMKNWIVVTLLSEENFLLKMMMMN